MVNMVHYVMVHRMATTLSLHCDRLSAISGGLCVSSGLLGTSDCWAELAAASAACAEEAACWAAA
jgi:hypothetical protein